MRSTSFGVKWAKNWVRVSVSTDCRQSTRHDRDTNASARTTAPRSAFWSSIRRTDEMQKRGSSASPELSALCSPFAPPQSFALAEPDSSLVPSSPMFLHSLSLSPSLFELFLFCSSSCFSLLFFSFSAFFKSFFC